jgi:UPF0271 protein
LVRVDLNADVGESAGDDQALMKAITSANIAAGFHAGSPAILRQTIRFAKAAGVAVGAHPGFPDPAGFGRREMHLTAQEAEDLVLYQVAAVGGVAASEGVRLKHVKPHGALYNMAARDGVLAGAIARAVAAFDHTLILVGPPGSEMLAAGAAAGLRVAAEAFADRAYEPDGSLMSRQKPGAVLHDPDIVASRALSIVKERCVVASDGSRLPLDVQTICVHGDTPGSAALAMSLRKALETAGVVVRPLGSP